MSNQQKKLQCTSYGILCRLSEFFFTWVQIQRSSQFLAPVNPLQRPIKFVDTSWEWSRRMRFLVSSFSGVLPSVKRPHLFPYLFSQSQHQVLLSLLSTCTVQFTFFLPPSLSCPLLSRNNLQLAVYLHLSVHPTPPSVSLPLCSSMTTSSLLLSIAHFPSLTTPDCKVRPL